MKKLITFVLVLAALTVVGYAADRFEVASIKAIRPTLANTVAALQKKDVAGARAAFSAYDSAWNGIEVYISTRSADAYKDLELNYQARITKGLEAAAPDTTALLADAKAMLAKFDETVATIEKAKPLNPLYDEVAKLRIERAHLREVNPALKAGDLAKARKSFTAFDDNWDAIEDLIKARSGDAYTAIEKGMIQAELALKPAKPDIANVAALVTGMTDEYNKVLAQIAKEAREAK